MDKKVVVGIVVVVLVIVGVAIFLINSGATFSNNCEKVENGYCFFGSVPSYMKFQEPTTIPETELYNFSKNYLLDYFKPVDGNFSKGSLCADSGKRPEIVRYFMKNCDKNYKNCEHIRYATICETFYIVEDYDSSGYGLTKYGPYDL
jgi:hypothetical protein